MTKNLTKDLRLTNSSIELYKAYTLSRMQEIVDSVLLEDWPNKKQAQEYNALSDSYYDLEGEDNLIPDFPSVVRWGIVGEEDKKRYDPDEGVIWRCIRTFPDNEQAHWTMLEVSVTEGTLVFEVDNNQETHLFKDMSPRLYLCDEGLASFYAFLEDTRKVVTP